MTLATTEASQGFNTRHTARVGTAMYWAPEARKPDLGFRVHSFENIFGLLLLSLMLSVRLFGFRAVACKRGAGSKRLAP